MTPTYDEPARDYLRQLHARHGWLADEEDVRQLAGLLERVVVEERQACLEIVDETVKLFGSYTAEQAAVRIQARWQKET